MVNFRPYTLQFRRFTNSAYDQDTGTYSGSNNTVVTAICNVTPNGSGKVTKSEDGQSIVYSYLIHANSDCPKIAFGTEVTVVDKDNQVKAKGKVINQFSNSKNTRIWL